ncbi:porin [Aquabacterium sp.]|uniref:porin n=1 Tax=Aquabacterium sp. TaxID=1872578 RepID=UPI002C42B4D3|nr:porin [Aquabacterium sp.]HSW04679.1 porin [Aquabacterium sp.]
MTPQLARVGTCALLTLTLVDGALAQSHVTVYGVVDAAALATRKGGRTVHTLESGMGATSRWGFIGSEDLGGGLSTGFHLEAIFKSDTGVVGSTSAQGEPVYFSRQSNVWLRSRDIGEVRLGRQYPAQISPAFDTFSGVSGFSPYASLSSIGKDQGAGTSVGDSRISRAVSYLTPDRFALGASVLYAFRNNSNPGYRQASAYGAEVHYASGPLQLQAQYMANNTDPTSTVSSFRNEWWGVGAQYKFNGLTASYIVNALVPKRANYLKSQTHALGFTIPYGTGTFRISPVYRAVEGRSDLNSFALGLGYDHHLSKRTALYTRAGYVDNRRNAIATLGPTSLAQPGDKLPLLALGMYHRF